MNKKKATGLAVQSHLRAGACNLSLNNIDDASLYKGCVEGNREACQAINEAGCMTDTSFCPLW